MAFAICITVIAGLSTGLGGLFVLGPKPKERTMALALGFAAGVMVTVSLMEMVPHAVATYAQVMTQLAAVIATASMCAIGMVIAALMAQFVPDISLSERYTQQGARALRSAIITTIALVAHNLPEGILTLFASVKDPEFGASMALAVALHNVPEGIAIAVPIYYATKSRLKGFMYALFSGIAEPIGALLAFGLFANYLSELFLNGMVASVAGIMLYVSFSELLPQAYCYNEKKSSVIGVCAGVFVMYFGLFFDVGTH